MNIKDLINRIYEKAKLLVQVEAMGNIVIRKYKAGTNILISEQVFKNIVVSKSTGTGRNLIARVLGSDNTYGCAISHGSLGTSSTPVTDNDTGLNALVLTVPYSGTPVVSNNIVTHKFFFPDGLLPNNTYREWGSWVATTQLFNHALITYVKAAGEDTTIEQSITINRP